MVTKRRVGVHRSRQVRSRSTIHGSRITLLKSARITDSSGSDVALDFACGFRRFAADPHVLRNEHVAFEDTPCSADQRRAAQLLFSVREISVEIDCDLP